MKEYVEHQVKSKVETFFTGFFKVVFMIMAAIIFILLFGYGFMLLWNWLMPEIFGLPSLTYWKAVGILVMAKLLFGSFESKGPGRNSKKGHTRFKKGMNGNCKSDFSKWEFYDTYWKEEGEKAFEAYVERQQNDNQ
jgi:hypothetical protein